MMTFGTSLSSRSSTRTFVARHFGADDVADLAAGGQVGDCGHVSISSRSSLLDRYREAVLTVQVSGNTRSEEAARCHGKGAAEVDHASERAAVEDVEAVLSWVSLPLLKVSLSKGG